MATIAVIGATGLVGRKLLEMLSLKLPEHKLVAYANTSVGQKIDVFGKTLTVQSSQKILPCKYAMLLTTDEVSNSLVPELARQGTICIDNSTAFRQKSGVPLVVPQINGGTVGCCKIISNPNCTTIQIAIALDALRSLQPTSVNVVTMQSASGAGRDGLSDLSENRTYGKLRCLPHPLCDNVIPKIGGVLQDGQTAEEQKIAQELPKILSTKLQVNALCTRIPVSVAHCAALNVKFGRDFTVQQVQKLLKDTPNVLLMDDAEAEVYPMPQTLRHTCFVGVGRLRKCGDGSLNAFVVADNLLVGAAYNAYKILEIALKNNE